MYIKCIYYIYIICKYNLCIYNICCKPHSQIHTPKEAKAYLILAVLIFALIP